MAELRETDPDAPVRLGRTRLTVTRLGLGTAPLGGLFAPVPAPQAHATIERAYETGLRLFDTAPLYGYGAAERRLGEVLRRHAPDTGTLATKVGRLLRAGAPPDMSQYYKGEPFYHGTPPVNPVFDFSYDGVMRSLDESLERLGLGRVDILHIHDPDNHVPEALAGAYRALNRLRADGTIAAVGVGTNRPEPVLRFAEEADVDCVLLAGRYTLLDQSGLAALSLCAQRGIAVIAGGVFNSGILAHPQAGGTFDYVPADPGVLAKALRLEAVCRRHGVPLAAAAMQFPFSHPAVASVLIGCRSPAEVDENVRLFCHDISVELWDELRRDGLIAPESPATSEGPLR
ncbi:MAG TPA: aldo/keto reductase [bacterium]|nr:aldo/keto reductase [bacterium]